MSKISRDLTWEMLGRYFGYPKCCVEEFVKRKGNAPEGRKFDGTGFIPCSKCNRLSEAVLIKRINDARMHSKPFPDDEGLDDDDARDSAMTMAFEVMREEPRCSP